MTMLERGLPGSIFADEGTVRQVISPGLSRQPGHIYTLVVVLTRSMTMGSPTVLASARCNRCRSWLRVGVSLVPGSTRTRHVHHRLGVRFENRVLGHACRAL